MKERPIFSWCYERVSRWEDPLIRRFREEVAGEATGRVLEVGVGNGMNLLRYRRAGLVVGTDPQPAMLRYAGERASAAGSPVALVRAVAEALPFADGSFDTVVFSLVLCSVEDPERALTEARRVLSPGGEVRFFEHVRSPEPRVARAQDRCNRPYGHFSGGCNMNRDSLEALRLAGFRVRYRRLGYGPRFAPHVIGVASPS
jgi:ubiquinone/menaquinone biosynthesis C-methylase UbiE